MRRRVSVLVKARTARVCGARQRDVAAVLAGEGDLVALAGLLDGEVDGDVDDAIAAVGDGIGEVKDSHAWGRKVLPVEACVDQATYDRGTPQLSAGMRC